MYYRRKILLSFIASFGEEGIAKLKLQKLLFLFCQKQQAPAYHFVPYEYGCFSFQATKDLQVLESHYRLIKQDGDKWLSNQVLDSELKTSEQLIFNQLIKNFKQKTDGETVNYVYNRYPYYSIYSKWRSMTPAQKEASQRERQAIEVKKQLCLFTIGYEGKSIDAYLNLLVKNNISLLCDVRKNPLSMKYGFSKKQLQKYCLNLSISYRHVPELGIESKKRQSLNNQQDYQNLFNDYRNKLPQKKEALDTIIELMKNYHRVALTCFENQQQNCHRHCVSDYLQKQNHELGCRHL